MSKVKTCQHCGSEFKGRISRKHKFDCDGWDDPAPKPPCLCSFHTESDRKMKAHRRECSLWQSRDPKAVMQARRKQNSLRKYGTESPLSKKACAIQGIKTGARALTHQEFLQRRSEKGGVGDFEYLNVYETAQTLLSIRCLTHNLTFEQRAWDHLESKFGCPTCVNEHISNSRSITHDEYIEKCLLVWGGDCYEYLSTYQGSSAEMEISCLVCKGVGRDHIFKQRASSHFSHGCPTCGTLAATEKRTRTPQEFEETANNAHNNQYRYFGDYVHSKTKVKIEHKDCGNVFYQNPTDHIRGNGCPTCSNSHCETAFGKVLETLLGADIKVERNLRPQWIKNPKTDCPLELDFYIPKWKVAFEIQGKQHYEIADYYCKTDKDLEYTQYKDQVKRETCKEMGVLLFEYDLRDIGHNPTRIDEMKEFIISCLKNVDFTWQQTNNGRCS